MKKISYLGPNGSNSHSALLHYAKQENIDNLKEIPAPTIEDAIIYLEEQKVDLTIVPIENSVEGSVNVTLDRLALNSALKISGELLLPIRYAFVSSKDTKNKIVKAIASHPQAIAQCREYIKSNFSDAKIIYTSSTSQAAKMCANSDDGIYAICSPSVLELYNLNIIAKDIQDFKNNCTRFITLTLNNENYDYNEQHIKLSILFSTHNKSGSLFDVLKIFKDLNINLTKIESRPAKNNFGEYIFFIDMEFLKTKDLLSKIDTQLSIKTNFYRYLGIYKSYTNHSPKTII